MTMDPVQRLKKCLPRYHQHRWSERASNQVFAPVFDKQELVEGLLHGLVAVVHPVGRTTAVEDLNIAILGFDPFQAVLAYPPFYCFNY